MLNASAASLARSLRADHAQLAQLGDDPRVVRRIRDRRDPGRVARGRARGAPRPPTSIISIASSSPTSLTPMAGANGLTLTTTMSMRPMPCARELLELGGDVAAGEDARRRPRGGRS